MEKKPKKHILIPCLVGLAVCLMTGAALYVKQGVSRYSGEFYPDTTVTIDGREYRVGGMSLAEAEEAVMEKQPSFTVLTRTGEETLSTDSMGISITTDPSIADLLKKQDPKHWLTESRKTWAYTAEKKYDADTEMLMAATQALPCMQEESWVYPKDAYIKKGETAFEIVPETQGTALDVTAAVRAVEEAALHGDTSVDLDKEGCYKEAAVKADHPALVQQARDINALVSNTITLDMTGAEETISAERLITWLDHDDATGGVLLDRDAVAAYVAGLAQQYNTFQTSRSFTTVSGDTIEVGGGADDTYGFWMDRDQTTANLCEAVLSGADSAKVVWKVPARTRNAANGDIGDTYIEVSIGRQHVWFVENGNVAFDADIVTGQGNDPSRMTHTGVFRVWNRKSPHHMQKYNVDCTYWMAFTWDGQGFHDAPWRGAFGGDIYMSSGSHGCCNMSLSDAKQLYSLTGWDIPVVIYN